MNDHGITKENLMETLPPALRTDPSVTALAEALATVLADRVGELDRLRIYPAIDRLEEPLLDILAYDFKVDWWDGNYSLEEKRRTLKGSWRVHKTLGTKAAVETAIRAIYPLSQVEEWFQYGGEPYHFRLNINITSDGGDKERQRRVLERMNFYKSLRSHNDGVRYFLIPEKSWATVGGVLTGSREEVRRELIVPVLTKPGATASATAGGTLAGVGIRQLAEVTPPELTRPGGRAGMCAVGGLAGSRERRTVKIGARANRPGGTAAALCGTAVIYSYQRRMVRITV